MYAIRSYYVKLAFFALWLVRTRTEVVEARLRAAANRARSEAMR